MSLSDDDYGLLSDEAKSAMYKFLNDFKGVLKFDKERLRHHWTEGIILDILCLSDSCLLFHLLARMPLHLFIFLSSLIFLNYRYHI
jgi:hypothetical protein